MNLNVLVNFPYARHYYLTHPWKFFKHCWQNLKDAWWRVTKGYAPRDVWDLNDWFLAIMPEMLRMLANDSVGVYPGVEPFETSDKWQDWLHSVADAFDGCTEEYIDSKNEYHDEYFDTLMNRRHDITTTWDSAADLRELTQLYRLREDELWEQRKVLLNDTFREFATHFDYLWG